MIDILSCIKNILVDKTSLGKKVALYHWRKAGRPLPPPHVYKIQTIREYAKQYKCSCFIETGTFFGTTLKASLNYFRYLASVELSVELYNKAKNKFRHYKNVHLYNGDSAVALTDMIRDLPDNKNILFWLDGHYSGGVTAKGDKDTPIIEELTTIFSMNLNNIVILIDDARCFNGENDYPTIDMLKDFVVSKNNHVDFSVKDDIIRIIF